ncbi:MAG: phage tail protein, partial [Chloroflexi bacterium]|nr:phage tail protein [Chloroflexota bacterium]
MSPDLQRHVDKYYGKYSGTVTDNQDAQQVGCIKVTVPSVFGKDMEVTARPCLPYGHFFVPHVGAKVWVEFEAGDTHFPIWVGVWYPNGKPPPEAVITPPDNRVIQTPSGHTIEIMDKQGEEKIVIKHKSNAFVSIDKNGSVMLGNKNGSTVVLNAKDKNVMVVE